jgi:hypothetical protein
MCGIITQITACDIIKTIQVPYKNHPDDIRLWSDPERLIPGHLCTYDVTRCYLCNNTDISINIWNLEKKIIHVVLKF